MTGALRSVLLNRYCSGEQIKQNEMGRACSAYGRQESCIRGLGGETGGKETAWKL